MFVQAHREFQSGFLEILKPFFRPRRLKFSIRVGTLLAEITRYVAGCALTHDRVSYKNVSIVYLNILLVKFISVYA